jgi:hypothetical protein
MTLQDHIHLDTTLQETGEKAPPAQYTVEDWSPQDEVVLSFDRAWDGTPYWGVVEDGEGNPLNFVNMRYTLRVTLSEYYTLRDILGYKVYLVDNDHVANGEDHTAYVRTMLFAEMVMAGYVNPALERLSVQVLLVDADTVASPQ